MNSILDTVVIKKKDFNNQISITWQAGKPDYYVVFNKQSGKIYARIYKELDHWAIWYEESAYSYSVSSFSEAIEIIEKEIQI